MQDGLTTSPAWLNSALGWIASFLTGATIFKLIEIWLNRKKPAAELHVTEETATEIKIRAHSTAGDALARMMDRLDVAQATIDKLRERAMKAEADAQTAQMFVDQLNAAAKLKGVRLSDYTPAQLKQAMEMKEPKED